MTSPLLLLAEKIEGLEQGDKLIDAQIKTAVGHAWDYAADWGPRGMDTPVALRYTASLDSAMSLVPETAVTSLAYQERWKTPQWTWGINDGRGLTHFGHAATPSLALCAAALRARAAMEAGE